MKTSKLRILGALVGLLAAAAADAGKPPRNTSPVVQMPPSTDIAVIPTAEAGPSVSMPPPHDDYVAPAAVKAPAPKVEAQARTENTRLGGGERGPVVELPQK